MRTVHTIALCALTLCALAEAAIAAPPTLEKTAQLGSTFMLPKGWAVKSTSEPIQQVTAEETPGSSTSPSLHYMRYPLSSGPNTAALHAQSVVSGLQGAQIVSRQAGPGGSVVEQWRGKLGGVDASMALVYVNNTAGGFGMTAVFAAPPARYADLGGQRLLLATLGLVGSPAAAAAPVGVKTKAAPAPRAASALVVPAAYAASNTPTLFYVAENLQKLSAVQVAQGLRRLNATEHQLVSVYSAFGNMLHGIACSADAGSMIMTSSGPKGCRATMTEWAQTLRLTNGDKRAAFEYALRQRDQFLISARCSNGQLDKASCNAYVSARRNDLVNDANTMTRIIANFGNACVVGDPGCVP